MDQHLQVDDLDVLGSNGARANPVGPPAYLGSDVSSGLGLARCSA